MCNHIMFFQFNSYSPVEFILVMEKEVTCYLRRGKSALHFNTKLLQTIAKKLDNISTANFEEVEEDVWGLDIPITTKEMVARFCLTLPD